VSKLASFLTSFRQDRKGVTLVEYAMALGVAVAIGGFIAANLNAPIKTEINAASSVLTTLS